MSGAPVLHEAADVTHAWLERALQRRVEAFETSVAPGTWSTHVRIVARVAGEPAPWRLRAKIASAVTFTTDEVDYYARRFATLADAPLVRFHHAAADATHYHVLMDDLAASHRDQHDVPPTEAYGLALAEAAAALHAHGGAQVPPDASAIERSLIEARAGLPAMLDAMRDGFGADDRALARTLLDSLAGRLHARYADASGVTWVHGDLNPGNVLAPSEGDGPLVLIDHQPFAGSGPSHGLAAADLAHALGVWWPEAARRAWERPVLERWHRTLVARGLADYPLEGAREDWRLGLAMGVTVPAGRCSDPEAVTRMRWLWEAQLRRVLAAARDHA